MRPQLERGGIGIGVLIREAGLESYRELLDVGTTSDLSFENMELDANDEEHTDIVYRTYRIYLGKQPALLVTEKFPQELYRARD
jgi:chorismate-pyruvate lyase